MSYTLKLSTERPESTYAFMVKRVNCNLPEPIYSGSVHQAIVAAAPPGKVDGWSWAHLEADEKDVIGQALQEFPADEWVWCELFRTNISQPDQE